VKERSPRPSAPGLLAAAAALSLLPALSWPALGPRYGGQLAVGTAALPATLEPAASGPGAVVLTQVHEPLLDVGGAGFPHPALAEGWSVAAGGREWSVRLREGLRFHDGAPVTAADAVRSLRRFLRGGTTAAAGLAAALEGGREYATGATDQVAGLTAADPRHVVLRFVAPRALPLAPLASLAASVTSTAGAGAGAFVPAAPVPGRKLALTGFNGHFGGRPYLDGLAIVPAGPTPGAAAEVRSGRIDLVPGPPGVSALAGTLLLVLDPSRAPFTDPKVREAVGAAIDRAEMVRHLVPGGDPAPSLVVPALLPPLGAPASPAAPTVSVSGSVRLAVDRSVAPPVSQRVVAHLTALGLDVSVSPLPGTEARAARAEARLLMLVPEVPEAALALRELLALAPSAPEAEAALDAADSEMDVDRRRRQLHRAEQALRDRDCLVPLASVPVSFTVRPGVHGARVDTAGRLILEDAWREP